MPTNRSEVWRLAMGLAMLGLVGCSASSRDYPGVSKDALWTAALDAANHPHYDDWFVAENGVFVDAESSRIEIHRELKRDRARDGGALKRESEEWSLSVRLDMEDRIPKVLIDSRSAIGPRGFLKQADHFFGEIDERLAQRVPGAPERSVDAPAEGGGLQAPTAREPSQMATPPASRDPVAAPPPSALQGP